MSKQIYMFDMDGTLLDLAYDDFIWNTQVPEHYMEKHQTTASQTKVLFNHYHQQYQHQLPWYSTTFWSQQLQLDVLKIHQNHAERISVRPGCKELLQQLTSAGHECWLITNADLATLQLKLEKTQIHTYFKHIISSEQIGHAKEDIEFWPTLKLRYPFSIQHSTFIDDTLPVLQQAKAFGFKQLWSIKQPSSTGKIKQNNHFPMLDQLTDLLQFMPTH